MRHRNHSSRLNRTSSHRKALLRNLAKSLIEKGKIQTTVQKAKELKKVIEPMVTLAKTDTLTNRRRVLKDLGIRFNTLSSKESKAAKQGETSSYNVDRNVMSALFGTIGPRYKERPGGYTRIVPTAHRRGDGAPCCLLEFV